MIWLVPYFNSAPRLRGLHPSEPLLRLYTYKDKILKRSMLSPLSSGAAPSKEMYLAYTL